MNVTADPVAIREEYVRRAAELVPRLAERALEAEEQRMLPRETVEDLIEAGLMRLGNPERHGGIGLDFDDVVEVVFELGRGCGSTAWCYSVWSVHNWMSGLASEQVLEDYYRSGPDVISSTGFNPAQAKVETVQDGLRLSGRWDFSSGCDYANWGLFGAVIPDERGYVLVLVPREDWKILDDWFVSGLRATGSKTVVIEEPVFVPGYRYLPMHGTQHSDARERHNRLLYGLPLLSCTPWSLVAPLVGIAQGAIDSFEDRMRTRLSAVEQRPMRDLVSIQTRLGQATAALAAAKALMRADLRELKERSAAGIESTPDDRVRVRRDHAYIAQLCVQAVNGLFEASGGHALYSSSPIQRHQRDIQAGARQAALSMDDCAEQYGRVRMGFEPTSLWW